MKIEYYKETKDEKLVLCPKSLGGVTFYNGEISQISLFPDGVLFKIDKMLPNTHVSPRYHKLKLDRRLWSRLQNYAMEGDLEKGLKLVEEKIETQINSNTLQFFKMTDNQYENKEITIIP